MDIMNRRYIPHGEGIADTKVNGGGFQNPVKIFYRDYTAMEKLDLIAWLNERDAGYPTAHVSAVRAAITV